ncbi:WD40 repeat domain-containing protein [Stappia indica]|uniref:WD-40 repeat-containing protein n=1 Tax=Stappia indica TaxID=538381 RepID=A0A285TIK1_9HYPH|nr:WD40 repeat domain-containing protein [Stappia indica]SOC21841.1 WD-40 repeat-containing protein [Stappia indica]
MVSVAPLDMGGFIVAAAFLRGQPAFASGAGAVLLLTDTGERRIPVHDGGLLVAGRALEGDALLSGGDDGTVRRLGADGTVETLAEMPRKWIDMLAAGPQRAVAYGAGRSAFVRQADGTVKDFSQPRAVGGLAFAPKGLRLAIARYDGATLQFVNTAAAPQQLDWKGAHKDVTFSPDGKYLVTTMQENALHGWRLSDGQDMRMTGYPGKIRSMSWSAKGRYLATSGANAAIVWSFFGKSGPMGQQPLQLGTRGDQIVTRVACHPHEEVVAIGYQDGLVLMSRFSDSEEVLLRRPGEGAVSALAWNDEGTQLAFGTETGEAGLISL